MTKIISSKRKAYLQFGANIWGKASFLWKGNKKDKWKNTPGEHKNKHRSTERVSPLIKGDHINDMIQLGYLTSKPNSKVKLSFYEPKYGSQLREKQKLSCFYRNVTEKQLRNYYKKALLYRGRVGDNLIKLLEKRLDTCLYRAHFVNSMTQAKQYISHGHIRVNGVVQNICSYSLHSGDIIQVDTTLVEKLCSAFNWDLVKNAGTAVYKHTPYLEVDYKIMSCSYLYTPDIEEVFLPFTLDMNKLIRHYL